MSDPAESTESQPLMPSAYSRLSTVPAGVPGMIILGGRNGYGLAGNFMWADVQTSDGIEGPDLVQVTLAAPRCDCPTPGGEVFVGCLLHHPRAPADVLGRVCLAMLEARKWPVPAHRRSGAAGPFIVNLATAAIGAMLRPGTMPGHSEPR